MNSVGLFVRNTSDSEPAAKRRKTATAVVDQPGQESKVLIDSVPDNTMNMDEVIFRLSNRETNSNSLRDKSYKFTHFCSDFHFYHSLVHVSFLYCVP